MATKKDTKKDTKTTDHMQYKGQIETTEKYWDCECKENYIHPKSQKTCFKCCTVAEDQPDSRVDEVLAQGLHL